MKPRSDRIIAEWAEDNRRTWVRRRDWHGRYRLAALCVVLLFAGLTTLLLFGSSLLATIFWIGAAASFVTMLRRSRDRRFFITRIDDFQDRR
jgi:Flp pilus assembly protein TadB